MCRPRPGSELNAARIIAAAAAATELPLAPGDRCDDRIDDLQTALTTRPTVVRRPRSSLLESLDLVFGATVAAAGPAAALAGTADALAGHAADVPLADGVPRLSDVAVHSGEGQGLAGTHAHVARPTFEAALQILSTHGQLRGGEGDRTCDPTDAPTTSDTYNATDDLLDRAACLALFASAPAGSSDDLERDFLAVFDESSLAVVSAAPLAPGQPLPTLGTARCEANQRRCRSPACGLPTGPTCCALQLGI